MSQRSSKLKLGILIFLLLTSFMLLAFGVAEYSYTITQWWIPVLPTAMVALGTAPMIYFRWESFTGVSSKIVNFLCHIFVFGSITYFLFIGINDWCSDPETKVTEQTEVINKYQKSHTRYRRVSRNRHVPDGHYYTYHLKLRFNDGREKTIEVPFETYRKTRNGGHRNVTLEKGFFGLTVIKR